MSIPRAIIKQVDHIAIRSNDPQYLFNLFKDSLQLPVVWPMAYYGFALSGVVCAGNTNIEVFNYGSAKSSSKYEKIKANIFAIAFEPTSISDSLRELSKRKIPHSPPIPYWGTRFDGYLGKLWSNVAIYGFLDASSRSLDVSKVCRGNLALNHFLGNLIGKIVNQNWSKSWILASFGERALYLTEYTHDVSEVRSIGVNKLRDIDGGLIGLEEVHEVIVGVSDFNIRTAHWKNLFFPILPSDSGLWHLDNGPSVRLTPSPNDDIQTIVLKVRSLEDAKIQLEERDLLGMTSGNWVSIAPSRIQNLDIRLVE